MKKALITGANGFIGYHLVKELLKNHYHVYAIVRKRTSHFRELEQCERFHLIQCEMNEYEKLLNYPEIEQSSFLFHLAWSGVSDENSKDYHVQLNNVICACDLQEVASQLGIRRLIFADSIMEYEHINAYQCGYYPVSLRNTYHVAKITARHLLQLRAANLKMEFIPAVISNVYGIGEKSPRLVNTAIRHLIAGKHMSFTSGEQMYDFIYIDDAVRAMRLAAEKGKNNRLYYIGNRVQRPLKSFLYEMRDITAPDMELGIGEIPYQGPYFHYEGLDTNGIFEDFHFEPHYTFSEGIQLTAKWIAEEDKNHENNYRCHSDL